MTSVPQPTALPPRYRGLSGAVAYGLLLTGIMVVLGILASGYVGLLTGAAGPSKHLAVRFALFAPVLGVAAALSRWICGGATDRLVTLRVLPGDLAAIGLLVGLVLAGYWAEQAPAAAEPGEVTLVPGQPVAIAGPTLDGKRFDLAQHRGKVVLVDFWATWCPPCLAEMPHVRAAYDRYHGRGLEVVGVSFDSDRADLSRFLENNPLPWPQIFFPDADLPGFENPLGKRYGIRTIPCLLVIDRDGNLVARNVRGNDIEIAVAQALGEPVPRGDRLAAGAKQLFLWAFQGLVGAPWWMVPVCGIGATVAAALVEWAVRRALRRQPATGQTAG